MISRLQQGRYTVLDASRFYVLQQPEPVAIQKLMEHGLSEAAAYEVLRRRVSDGEYRSTFILAAASTAVSVETALQSVPEAADVDDIRERQAGLSVAIEELRSEVAASRLLQERKELEAFLESEATRLRDALVDNHIRPGPDTERIIWARLWQTEAGQRLSTLRDEQ